MNLRNITVLFLLMSSLQVVAQRNIKNIEESSKRLEKVNEERIKRIDEFVKSDVVLPSLYYNSEYKVYDVINGLLIFKSIHNDEAAFSVNVDRLRDQSLGLNLSGDGILFGAWDGGNPRISHVELKDNVFNVSGDDISNHATHVTGTMVAKGINARAMGMAPNGKLRASDFDNDTQEMVNEQARDEPLIISNHSYGTVSGWTFNNGWTWAGDPSLSPNEDWKFGFYNQEASEWDQLTYDSPYYVIVKSAGNDRNDAGDGSRAADGPYDLMSFTSGAKNIITVGAAEKLQEKYTRPADVGISAFSNWGPTDDGRIKPDIVATGVGVLSSGSASDDNYVTLSGTSMSAPVVAGTAGLLQEAYMKLNAGQLMRNSTVKGLMLHTAYETGNAAGPDYTYGWGMLNASAAVEHLLHNANGAVTEEVTLNDQGTFELLLNPKSGTAVKATIVWTDLPGTPVATALDPTDLMLVNDLDLRVSNASGEINLPWILDPASPANIATRGDNFRDNVEQVEFSASDDNNYTLTVTHKGSLGGSAPQVFSLFITYVPDNEVKTYYWINKDGGELNGVANWAAESGGETLNQAPGINDVIVFDANSLNDNAVVVFNSDVEVKAFRWLSSNVATLEFNGNQLATHGDLVLASENLTITKGTLRLVESESGKAVLSINGPSLETASVMLDAPNTVWSLKGNTTLNELIINSGQLLANNLDISINRLIATENADALLSLSNTSLHINNTLMIQNDKLTLVDNTASFIVDADREVDFTFSLPEIRGTIIVNGKLNFNSSSTVNQFNVSGNLVSNENLIVNSASFEAGGSLSLENEVSFEVVNDVVFNGTSEMPVSIIGLGDASGDFTMNGHRKICVDFLDITNVDYSGNSALSVGLNSQLATNADNWSAVSCDNLLFADFSFEYGCVNSLVEFTDESSGNIMTWLWDFSDGNTSMDQSPIKTFDQEGTYAVELDINDGNSSYSFSNSIEIGANILPENSIVANGDLLTSRRGAISYQWYLDGEKINGATEQSYATQGVGGMYGVLIFDETCNRLSDTFQFVVTGIENDPEELLKLEEALEIFPNPSNDVFNIAINNYDLKSLSISLIDPRGSVLMNSVNNEINDKSFSGSIDVSDYRDGVYILRLLVNDKVYITRKLLRTE